MKTREEILMLLGDSESGTAVAKTRMITRMLELCYQMGSESIGEVVSLYRAVVEALHHNTTEWDADFMATCKRLGIDYGEPPCWWILDTFSVFKIPATEPLNPAMHERQPKLSNVLRRKSRR